MIQKIINILFKKRHFWRNVGFDELSELYTSEFLRSLAMSLIGIFVPIYLYKLGYSLTDIFGMQVIWAAIRPPLSYMAAKSVAIFGPKHTMVLASIVQIVYLATLMSMQSAQWPLALLAVLGSLSYTLFNIAIQVDFSKVKHTEHGGKELGFLTIFERFGAAVGPLVGGAIATFVFPQATIFIAIVVMALSLVPLFLTAEPTRTNQFITLKGFPWKRHKHDFIAATFFGVENVVSIVVWPLFISIVLFTSNTYAIVGLLTSVGTAMALLTFYLIGKLIDDKKGGLLLKVGVFVNSIMHILRIFVTTPIQALLVSIVNEPVTASYRMPFAKGLYDAADSVTGYRIVYITLFDSFRMFGLLIFWSVAFVTSLFIHDEKVLLQTLFVYGAISSLGILTQRFAALR